MPKSLFILLLCSLSGGFAFGQTKDVSVPIFFEKAYLHTDRDVYTQTEDIWFKAYLVNAQTNEPINFSHILYVELISPQAKIISRQMLRLENGLGNGDFKLTDTIAPGNYRLRAYTNYMRNFGDNFIFEKRVRIINDVLDAHPGSKSIGSKGKSQNSAIVQGIADTTAVPVVRFFPEGGSLINGVISVVAVKAEDAHGRGIRAAGQVLNPAGEAIADFTCDSLGMGSFMLLPIDKQLYKANVNIKGIPRQFKLPEATATGFNMRVQVKPANISLVVSCNDLTFNQYQGQHIYLTIKHAGKTYIRQGLMVNNKNLLVNIPDSLLAEGINAITIMDGKTNSLCERLMYVHHKGRLQLAVSTNKAAYQPKERVTVNIKLSAAGKANLSLAAVDAATVPVPAENILSYLELSSEIRGTIEHPDRYFDTTNVNRFKQLDLLLLTQGWRNFIWKRLEDANLKITREVEQDITITGKVTKTSGKGALTGIDVTMRAPGAKGQKLFYTSTDAEGRFNIYGLVFYGYQYLFFTSRQFSKKGQVKSNSGGWVQVDSLKTRYIAGTFG